MSVQPAPAGVVTQATAVEQSRAVAEVQAAIVVAQNMPRDIQRAIRDRDSVCQVAAFAANAFYAYPKGLKTVEGLSIHAARELARVWGNIQYGLVELERNDRDGWSDMSAWAWDLETNVRPSQVFRVPHRRTRTSDDAFTSLRDIYENNANMGSRRVRAQIFSVLPSWFVSEAEEILRKTRDSGGGVPIEVRIDKAIELFHDMGVERLQIEKFLSRKSSEWNPADLGRLTTVYQSIRQGDLKVSEVFPLDVAESLGIDVAVSAGVPVEDPPGWVPGS